MMLCPVWKCGTYMLVSGKVGVDLRSTHGSTDYSFFFQIQNAQYLMQGWTLKPTR